MCVHACARVKEQPSGFRSKKILFFLQMFQCYVTKSKKRPNVHRIDCHVQDFLWMDTIKDPAFRKDVLMMYTDAFFWLHPPNAKAHWSYAAVLCLRTQVPFCGSVLELRVCARLNVAEGDSWP